MLRDYHTGTSQSQLVGKYGVEWRKLRKILDSNKVLVRDKSQQAFLARYGVLPRVRPGITIWKLYVIFAMLGDNLRPSSQTKRGTHIIGIAAGGDTDFAENWVSNFEHEYKVRPALVILGANNVQGYISSVDVWRDLHKHAVFGRRCWRLRGRTMRLLLSRTRKSVLGFGLRGFFDAEGSVKYQRDRAVRQVAVYSVNFPGLRQVSRLLERLGIRHRLYANTISIMGRGNLEAFQKTIGFSIKRKNEALNNMISTFHGR